MKALPLTKFALLFALLAMPARSAYLIIDDSDVNTMTITAGNFEGGFFVDGVLLSAFFQGTVTVQDGAHQLSGMFVDIGRSTLDPSVLLTFGTSSVTSGVALTSTTDQSGFSGIVNGMAYGYTGTPFLASVPLYGQGGLPRSASLAGGLLTVQFIPEEPGVVSDAASSLGLFGLALGFLALGRKRLRIQTV